MCEQAMHFLVLSVFFSKRQKINNELRIHNQLLDEIITVILIEFTLDVLTILSTLVGIKNHYKKL